MSDLASWRRQANSSASWRLLGLGVLLLGSLLLGIMLGALPIDLLRPLTPLEAAVLSDIRLPRVIMTMTTGAGLAAAGLVLQALCRNPLADPGIIGVSSSAALFAASGLLLTSSVTLSGVAAAVLVPSMAFAGALLALVLLISIASYKGEINALILILTGIIINAGAFTFTSLITYLADDNTLRSIVFWQMGSYGGISWFQATLAVVVIAPAIAIFYSLAKKITLLQIGEQHSFFCGVNVGQLQRVLLVLVAAITAISVCFTGVVGFVGLVVPHLCRMAISHHLGVLVIASTLLGGALVTLADVCARVIIAPAELPIGLLTSALGVPFFLGLVIQQKRKLSRV